MNPHSRVPVHLLKPRDVPEKTRASHQKQWRLVGVHIPRPHLTQSATHLCAQRLQNVRHPHCQKQTPVHFWTPFIRIVDISIQKKKHSAVCKAARSYKVYYGDRETFLNLFLNMKPEI